jgi:phosphopantothenoylcysteine synthetase/decarboxylase
MAISILSGKEVFVTSGSTRAYLDAVRYLSNESSGRLGAEIAVECLRRGAYVSYFHGKGALTPFNLQRLGEVELSKDEVSRLDLIQIDTVPDLAGALEVELKDGDYDVAIHAMAVLDFIPDMSSVRHGKVKSDEEEWTVKLVRTPKVIDMIKKVSPETVLVGFKLEVDQTPEQLIESAKRLIKHSGADIVVANDLREIKAGSYKATLIEKSDGEDFTTTDVDGRKETGIMLCDRLEHMIRGKQ